MEASESLKFGAHRLNSHLTGECVWLSTWPLWHLALWILTWPGVKAYALAGPTFTFHDRHGVVRTTAMTASAVLKGDRLAYFSLGSQEDDAEALEVQRAHACHLGADFFPFSVRQLYSNSMEVANRRDAHMFLFQARGLHTAAWEAAVLLQARQPNRSLGEMAQNLELTWEQTCVGFLKAWLSEKVHWDIGAKALNRHLRVTLKEARDGHA